MPQPGSHANSFVRGGPPGPTVSSVVKPLLTNARLAWEPVDQQVKSGAGPKERGCVASGLEKRDRGVASPACSIRSTDSA